jgi:uncharacterized membrane protein
MARLALELASAFALRLGLGLAEELSNLQAQAKTKIRAVPITIFMSLIIPRFGTR